MKETKSVEYVLVADDDVDDIEILSAALSDLSNPPELIIVKNGIGVMDYLQKWVSGTVLKPCLVVMDMNMPIMDGRETVVAIKGNEAFKNLPVILFSTSKNKTDELFAQKWGVRYFEKPDTLDGINKMANLIAEGCRDN